MQQLLALERLPDHANRKKDKDPDTNPGNNGPINPAGTGGGNNPGHHVAHAYEFLTAPTPQLTLRIYTLADLRIIIKADAQPEHGRIAIYPGHGDNPVPLFMSPLKVEPVPGANRTFQIPSSVVQAAEPLVVAGHTLGLEFSGRGFEMAFQLESIAK